ncbi:hypothetical protein D3C79_994180 [compost metagenome]
MAVALNHTAMITDNLGNKRQSQARTIGLCGHKWIKQMRQHIFGNARTIIVHAEFEWKRHAVTRARNLQANARTIGC